MDSVIDHKLDKSLDHMIIAIANKMQEEGKLLALQFEKQTEQLAVNVKEAVLVENLVGY